jgi:hypothetical protein
MATITKLPDGDFSLGNLRGELITLQPAVADYATGGYLIQGIGGTTENTGNVGIDKVLFVLPTGGQGGLSLVWNPSTSKLQIFQRGAVTATGTVASTSTAPTITTGTNATVTGVVATNGGALTQTAGASGITGVQAPTITSTFTGTAVAAGALMEVPAGTDLSAYAFQLLAVGL